jgi:hypothetical protein
MSRQLINFEDSMVEKIVPIPQYFIRVFIFSLTKKISLKKKRKFEHLNIYFYKQYICCPSCQGTTLGLFPPKKINRKGFEVLGSHPSDPNQ